MFVFGGLLNLKKGSMVFFSVPSAKVISLITFSASSNTAGIGPFGACGAATDFTLGSHTTGCYCWKKSQTTTWLVLEILSIMGIFTIYQLILQDFSRSTVWFNSFRPVPTCCCCVEHIFILIQVWLGKSCVAEMLKNRFLCVIKTPY